MQFVTWMVNITSGLSFPITLEVVVVIVIVVAAVSDLKCYECDERGHFACECWLQIGFGGLSSGSGYRRSRTTPIYRRSPSVHLYFSLTLA